jgi:aspartate carbamoyltransferase catalytic subunit
MKECDAVMMLRIQTERMKSAFFPSAREYSRLFGLDSERLSKSSKSPLILHPGPINRGLEISAECADDVNSVILEQVANGVSVRMAVLYLLLGGANE